MRPPTLRITAGFSEREAEYIDGIDAGIDATDNHRLQRRYDLQVCGKAAAGEGLVALGQGVNDTHWIGDSSCNLHRTYHDRPILERSRAGSLGIAETACRIVSSS